MAKEWFQEWFESPYYHILYQNHDENEAAIFLSKMVRFLQLNKSIHKLLDVACGWGRHSQYLHSLGFSVVGYDLSAHHIHEAKKFEAPGLNFYQHDMRVPNHYGKFDVVLNLFTSFGYFNTDEEHVQSLKCIHHCLQPNGWLVLDYFNVHKILPELPKHEMKHINDVYFELTKTFDDGNIIKNINVMHQDKKYSFKEKVKTYQLSDFERFMLQSGLEIKHVFGNYALHPYTQTSDRLLIFAQNQA